MKNKELAKKIILSNIQNYQVADRDVENIYYKANDIGAKAVLIGGASLGVAARFASRPAATAVACAYPSGAVDAALKAFEITDALAKKGDICCFFVSAAMGWFQSGHVDDLRAEMQAAVAAAKGAGVWFIVELTQMSAEQIKSFCDIAKEEGVCGIMTSTDFYPYEFPVAGPDEIKALRALTDLQIAAPTKSGDEADWQALIDAGADLVIVNADKVPAGDA